MKEALINIAIQAARSAGNIIARASDRLDKVKVSEKSPNDFVTEIDKAAEREIISIIRKAHPNHAILAEESGETPGSDYTWIIDPLDGTRNFIHGFPHYAVSIGIIYKNQIEHGVIYDPMRDELFSASRGKGAKLNEHRIRVNNLTKVQQPLLGTGFPYRHSPQYQQAFNDALYALFPMCGDIRRAGAAALDLAYVACGRLDGFWELKLKKWDMAAGILLVKEAGGLVCDVLGGETYFETGNVAAGNPKVLKSLIKTIHPFMEKIID